jgi:hypothetical protein
MNGDGTTDVILCTPRFIAGYLVLRTASQVKAVFALAAIILLVVLLIVKQRKRRMDM